ncbi:MAG: NifB/NifX family molybdenum-iron cluster-binding protein [bacterium]
MAEKTVVAVPSMAPGGIEAELSGHFGHCDIFTLVTIEGGKIGSVELQQNVPHEQGGCMAPVNLLAQKGANALIAGGMGMRPLMGFNSVGIEVFHNQGIERVGEAVAAFAEGKLPAFSKNNVCGGGGEQHGGGGGHM